MWFEAFRVSSNRYVNPLHNFNSPSPPSCDIDVTVLVEKYIVSLVSFRFYILFQKIHQHSKRVFVVMEGFRPKCDMVSPYLVIRSIPSPIRPFFVTSGTKRSVNSCNMMGGINELARFARSLV